MKKEQFLRDLGLRLSSLPYADKKRSLDFYSEMIDDRIEDGISEEEAVKKMGTPAFAAEKILTELPITTLARKSPRLKIHLFYRDDHLSLSYMDLAFSRGVFNCGFGFRGFIFDFSGYIFADYHALGIRSRFCARRSGGNYYLSSRDSLRKKYAARVYGAWRRLRAYRIGYFPLLRCNLCNKRPSLCL